MKQLPAGPSPRHSTARSLRIVSPLLWGFTVVLLCDLAIAGGSVAPGVGPAGSLQTAASGSHPHWVPDLSLSNPGHCFGQASTYDPKVGGLVVFGGDCGSSSSSYFARPTANTWELVGGNWAFVNAPGPSPRTNAAMAYDPYGGYAILYGGVGGPNSAGLTWALNDTWKFDRSGWTNITASAGSPGASAFAALAYDKSDGYVVMFGGQYSVPTSNSSSNWIAHNITWKFQHGTWTNLTTSVSAPPGPAGGMAYDDNDGYVVLYGVLARGPPAPETWSFHAGNWTRIYTSTHPFARFFMGLAYSPLEHGVLLYGGEGYHKPGCLGGVCDQTWKYANGTWTQLAGATPPSPRYLTSMSLDPSAGGVVLFGGANRSGLLNDTWEFR